MRTLGLAVLLEDAIEHGEDGLLLGLGEAGEALELALVLGGGPPLAGVGAGDAEEHIGGHGEERGESGDEGDGEAEAADLVMGEGGDPSTSAIRLGCVRRRTTSSVAIKPQRKNTQSLSARGRKLPRSRETASRARQFKETGLQ